MDVSKISVLPKCRLYRSMKIIGAIVNEIDTGKCWID